MTVTSIRRNPSAQAHAEPQQSALVAEESGFRFYRGLFIGLSLSGLLWLGLGALVWSVFGVG